MRKVNLKLLVAASVVTAAAGLCGQSLAAAQGGSHAFASANPKKGKTFKGKTAQKKVITFKVAKDGRSATIVKVGYSLKCGTSPGTSGNLVHAPKIKISKGKLSYTSPPLTFKGSFTSSTKAKGTIRLSTVNASNKHCTTGTVRWTAGA
jgi:hypothetical protein